MHVTTLFLAFAASSALAMPQPRAYFHPDRPHLNIIPQHPGRPHHAFNPDHQRSELHHSLTLTPTPTITAFPTAAVSSNPAGLPTVSPVAAPFPIINGTTTGAAHDFPFATGTGVVGGAARPTGVASPIGGSAPGNWTGGPGQPHRGHGHGGHEFGRGHALGKAGKHGKEMHDSLRKGASRTRPMGKYVPKGTHK